MLLKKTLHMLVGQKLWVSYRVQVPHVKLRKILDIASN